MGVRCNAALADRAGLARDAAGDLEGDKAPERRFGALLATADLHDFIQIELAHETSPNSD